MWELDYKESWAVKNWCFWIVMSEKTLESPLDCKEIQPVHPQGNQSWMLIGRTDEAETPILWPPDVKDWLIGEDPDAVRDWRQEKGTTEDEMVGCHHQLNGHEFEQAAGLGWWTGKPGMLQSMGSQRVGPDWATELNWGVSEEKVLWCKRTDRYTLPKIIWVFLISHRAMPGRLFGIPHLKYLKSTLETELSGGTNGEEPACKCKWHKRCGFNPWVRKISWKRVGGLATHASILA